MLAVLDRGQHIHRPTGGMVPGRRPAPSSVGAVMEGSVTQGPSMRLRCWWGKEGLWARVVSYVVLSAQLLLAWSVFWAD